MSINREDKFEARYFGQMTDQELADFRRMLGEDESLRRAYEEYKALQDAFLAEEYTRNQSETTVLTAADEEEMYFYLEGEITDPVRIEAIKTRLETDENYRAEYELMRAVAQSEKDHEENRAVVPPVVTAGSTATAKVRPLRPALYRRLGVAAAVLLLLTAAWWAMAPKNYDAEVTALIEESSSGVAGASAELYAMRTGSLSGNSDTLELASLASLKAGDFAEGEALLEEMRTSFPQEWAGKYDLQNLYIMLLTRSGSKAPDEYKKALALISEFKESIRRLDESEKVKQRSFLLPMAYREALLLTREKDTRDEAILLLRTSLENENLKPEDAEKMQTLLLLID